MAKRWSQSSDSRKDTSRQHWHLPQRGRNHSPDAECAADKVGGEMPKLSAISVWVNQDYAQCHVLDFGIARLDTGTEHWRTFDLIDENYIGAKMWCTFWLVLENNVELTHVKTFCIFEFPSKSVNRAYAW